MRGSHAVLRGDKAYAPSRAPYQVKQVIWSANRIRHKPYKWGGGHGTWDDSGYDCSGAVSYALHGAALLSWPLDSRGFMKWGKAGAGHWITVFATNGHAYMVVAGLRFDTSGAGLRQNEHAASRAGRPGPCSPVAGSAPVVPAVVVPASVIAGSLSAGVVRNFRNP